MAAATPSRTASTTTCFAINRLLTLDTAISRRLHYLCRPFVPTFILMLLELSADFRFFFPIAIGLAVFPVSVPFLPFLSRLILGLILDILVIAIVKLIFRRQRPSYNPAMSPVVSVDHFSFPSGHASRAFFVASLVFLSSASLCSAIASNGNLNITGREEKTMLLIFNMISVWAVSTAASRVLLGRHYLFDVLAGIGIGFLEGFVAFHFLSFEEQFLKFTSLIWGYFEKTRIAS